MDRLRTRFEWGLTVDVQPPDFELRLAIIKDKARSFNVEMTDAMLSYIAENLRSNIRQLEGSVKKIKAKTFLSGEALTLDLVKECISSLITGDESPMITADKIISIVAKRYDISKDDILSKKRDQNIAYARNVSIYVIRSVTQMSFPEIGKIFNRDHSTIMSSNKVIQEKVASNQLTELEINEIIRELSE
jgi:chromosomal replication initiator protein